MKGVLRQKLESIAGKVLAVASAAGLPLKQTFTRGASGGGGGGSEGRGETKPGAEKRLDVVDDDDDDDSEQEEDKWDQDGYVEVIVVNGCVVYLRLLCYYLGLIFFLFEI